CAEPGLIFASVSPRSTGLRPRRWADERTAPPPRWRVQRPRARAPRRGGLLPQLPRGPHEDAGRARARRLGCADGGCCRRGADWAASPRFFRRREAWVDEALGDVRNGRRRRGVARGLL